jgi:hypothetical protein
VIKGGHLKIQLYKYKKNVFLQPEKGSVAQLDRATAF